MLPTRRRFLALAAAALLPRATPADAGTEARALVFAAASLGNALDDAAAAFGADRLRLSYAATSALARQIAHGAPAALFVSADEAWMDELAADGALVPGTRRVVATNRLVVIGSGPAPAPSSVTLSRDTPLARRLGDGRLAVAMTDGVPAGRYARAALTALGQWEALATRLAETDNVRAALALVARGEAPLGIVYATDAAAEPRVHVVAEVPAAAHPPIRYPAAVVAGAPAPERAVAAAFLDFLTSSEGQAILVAHGFGPSAGAARTAASAG